MLDEHFEVLPVDKLRYGPFYDQMSVRNKATGASYTTGGAELLPGLLSRRPSTDILEPSGRAVMYIDQTLYQIYGETTKGQIVGAQIAFLNDFHTRLFLHKTLSDDISAFQRTTMMRIDYRDVELLLTTATDVRCLACDGPLNMYLLKAEIAEGRIKAEDLLKEDSDESEEK